MGVKITVAGIEYLNSEHSEVVENQHITTVDCPFPFRQKLIAAYKRERAGSQSIVMTFFW